MSGRRRLRLAGLALAAAGAAQLAAGLYLPAKALAAQALLRVAWERGGGGRPVRPWPWANTWPVARLEVPRLGIDAVVLAGAEGAAMAFGPGHVDGTPLGAGAGNTVLAGHRDTHFRFLAELRPGDELWLETPGGRRARFAVAGGRVVHETDLGVLAATPDPTLTLITCYPFDAARPGGPLRYVVRAVGGDGEVGAGGEPHGQRRDA